MLFNLWSTKIAILSYMKLDLKSHDDIPQILRGIQHIITEVSLSN